MGSVRCASTTSCRRSCSATRATSCAHHVVQSSRAVPRVGVSSAETFGISQWKKSRPQSCSPANIPRQVVVPRFCTRKSWTMKRLASTGPTRAPVLALVASGRARSNRSCRTWCRCTRASPRCKGKTSCSLLQTSTCPVPWIGSWCRAVSGTISCWSWRSKRSLTVTNNSSP